MALMREEDHSWQSGCGGPRSQGESVDGFGVQLCQLSGSVWACDIVCNLGGSWGLVVLFCCHPTPFPSSSSFYTAWHWGEGWDHLGKAAAPDTGDGARY